MGFVTDVDGRALWCVSKPELHKRIWDYPLRRRYTGTFNSHYEPISKPVHSKRLYVCLCVFNV